MREVSISEFGALLAANCDFHDTELMLASHDPAARTLTLDLREVYHIGKVSNWWEVSIPRLTVIFGGLRDFEHGDLGDLTGYTIYRLAVAPDGSFHLDADTGQQVRAGFSTIHIAPDPIPLAESPQRD